jgi:hypothetical protein
MDNEASTESNLSGDSGLDKYLDDANLESLGASEDTTDETPKGDDSETTDELSLDSFEADEGGDPNLLNYLNELGVLHKGLPVNFDNMDQVKEYLSKGHDYTQKTQELAKMKEQAEVALNQEREAFAQERQAFDSEREHFANNQLILDAFLRMVDDIRSSDQALYEELDGIFTRHQRDVMSYQDNPALNAYDKRIKELEAKLAEKDEAQAKESDNRVLQEWEDGLKTFQSKNQAKLRSLGVSVDYQSVRDTWAADKTGKMSVDAAVNAVYGEQIRKALEAKAKLATTKKRTADRSNASTDQEVKETLYKDRPGDYMSHLERLANKYAS